MLDPMEQNGEDVTVNFYSPDIKNDGTFYTDSNGLEMQKRKLNKRRDFDVSIADGMEITSNFYPVTSAIAIKDANVGGNMQMVVSNSHSQGGSSIKEGRIELVQHRTSYDSDKRGLDEALYDVDEAGNPIPVQATYHVQIHGRNEKSNQREV